MFVQLLRDAIHHQVTPTFPPSPALVSVTSPSTTTPCTTTATAPTATDVQTQQQQQPTSAAHIPSTSNSPTPDTTLSDITFLHQFKQKMVDTKTEKPRGRYSLIDR